MTELAQTIHEALRELAARDRSLLRFGAAQHRYELTPPVTTIADLGDGFELPEDLAEFVTTVGASGAGPSYGLLSLAEPRMIAEPRGLDGWTRAVIVGHLGCGYAAVVPLDGEGRGQVWIHARSAGAVRPISPSFTAYYADWIDRLARGKWPEIHVPPSACPLPNALGAYLGAQEERRGLAPGTLAGDQLRQALADLGPHSIEIAADSSALFPDGMRVDPCVGCAHLVDNLQADGLLADAVAPGIRL